MRKSLTVSRLVVLIGLSLALPIPGWSASYGPGVEKESVRPLRSAIFEVRHELKVMVPEGAKRVRIWFAFPQEEDLAQQVRDLRVEAPYPYRVERDSEGNTVLYLEAENPKEKELTVVESFTVSRSEVRSGVDPSKARPLSDSDRAGLERYLRPNKSLSVNSDYPSVGDQRAC
jgi:hypothetical protein